MSILIGADLVPTDSNKALFAEGNGEALVGQELLTLLRSADHRIFNLEVPLTDTAAPIDKCGPALIAPTASVAGYKALGADCLTVGNNHIMDQGVQGLRSTVKVMAENGIALVGAGDTRRQAAEPYIWEWNGRRLGIYACAEHEFSIAGDGTPGANPFDPLESPDHVAALKERCDYVIVLYHGGKEHYRYPSPELRRVCRKLVEKGADLVLCQHSHCIGCEEKYENGTVVYGQGNFLFDRSQSEYWQTGLLVRLDRDLTVSYIPLVKQDCGVRLAPPEKAAEIMDAFCRRSAEIREEGFVEARYGRFAGEMKDNYLRALSSVDHRGLWFRLLNRLTGQRWSRWYLKRAYGKRKLLVMRNYIECEAHRELMLKGLE